MDQLPTLAKLLKQLQLVPYLASKNIYRIAHYFLELDEQQLQLFCKILKEAHEQLHKCHLCFAWKERDRDCGFCISPQRNKEIICVVETWHDLSALEKTSAFKGVYHVLGGALSPLEGIGPDQLTLKALQERVKNGCSELILAMNQTPEGEATAAYIARLVQGFSIKITCLARGIPVGSMLETMDRLTVLKALTERRLF
ncbi:MAG: recombination mediator RecR [Candidatus Babeliaceae bacterium]